MKKPSVVLAGLAVLVALTGCAAQEIRSYETIDDLYVAFGEAGGECDPDGQPRPYESSGVMLHCDDGAYVLGVFDSVIAFDEYLEGAAATRDSLRDEHPDVIQEAIRGENWVAFGEGVADLAGALGGEPWDNGEE